MGSSTRRTLLAGLLGATAAGGAVLPLAAQGPGLPLPPAAMRLRRVLVREFGGGAAITVQREWRIAFARQAGGVRVTGAETSARVEAPSALAALARIEEQRRTQALFPILLSAAGLIIAHGAAAVAQADLAAAADEAERLIARLPGGEARQESMRRYLAMALEQGAGQFETLPADLFFPSGTPLRRVENVALPDGSSGQFELTWEARAAAQGGMLAQGERQVVTRIAGRERRSREVWSLHPV